MVHALHSNGANSIWEHSLLDPTNSKSGRKKPLAKDPVKYSDQVIYLKQLEFNLTFST